MAYESATQVLVATLIDRFIARNMRDERTAPSVGEIETFLHELRRETAQQVSVAPNPRQIGFLKRKLSAIDEYLTGKQSLAPRYNAVRRARTMWV